MHRFACVLSRTQMNIHHLELFYFVARYGGISRAVRHMPYGIQQPTVSAQVKLLEEDLGLKLFERKPFKLTTEGQELLEFVRPFFDNLDAVGVRLRKLQHPQLRIGSAEIVLRDHLPAVIQQLKQTHPGLRLGLRSGFQPELEAWLQDGQIDLAIIPLRGRLPKRMQRTKLLRLPLVLLVHKKSRIRSAEEFLARGRIDEPLIGLPTSESVSSHFQRGLKKRGVEWPVTVEASSMALITQYVANGYGAGVNVAVPDIVRHPLVRVLPLAGFEPLEVAAVWQGKPTPLIRTLVDGVKSYVKATWGEDAALADG